MPAELPSSTGLTPDLDVGPAHDTPAAVLIPQRRADPVSTAQNAATAVGGSLDPRQAFESLRVIECLREQVLRDIAERDRCQLVDSLMARIEPKLTAQTRDQIKAVAAAEISDRVKVFGTLAGLVSLTLGFVGYTSMRDALTTTAHQSAAEVAAKEAESQVRAQVAGIASLRQEIVETLARGETRISESVSTAQRAANQAMIDVTNHANRATTEFASNVQKRFDDSAIEARNVAAEERASAKQSLEAAKNEAVGVISDLARERRNDLEKHVERERRELDGVVAAEVARQISLRMPNSLRPETPSAKSATSSSDASSRGRQERVMQIDAARTYEFATLARVASEFDGEQEPSLQRSILEPVLNYPSRYDELERRQTVQTLLAPIVPAADRRNAAIEVMIVGARCSDRMIFDLADKSLTQNLYTRLGKPDDFVEFVRAVVAAPNSESARASYGRVNISDLTLRGRINMLSLGKLAGVESPLIPLQSAVLSDLFVEDADHSPAFLDRWSDYPAAAYVVDVLLQEPVLEPLRVRTTLERIRGLIFDSDADPDPFELRGRIDGFLDR